MKRRDAILATAATLASIPGLAVITPGLAEMSPKWILQLEEALAKQLSNILLLGEIHGTNEIPALAWEAVQYWLAKRSRVVLGLEIDNSEQRKVAAYIGGDIIDDVAASEDLLRGSFWSAPSGRDGRASLAILNILKACRSQILEKNAPISVRTFGGLGHLLAHKHLVDGYDPSTTSIVVLTGDRHAQRSSSTIGSTFEKGVSTAVKISPTAGSAWVCVSEASCSPVTLFPRSVVDTCRSVPCVVPATLTSGFDFELLIGRVSPSRPALD